MIEIKSDRKIAFLFNSVKVIIYFALIFYATKLINNYVVGFLEYIMINGSATADFSGLLFLVKITNGLFEHFFYDLIIVLLFVFAYSLKNKYEFRDGFLYYYKGFFFVKERTISYNEIREIDYEKTVFNIGTIIVRLHEEKKPVVMPYVSKVKERFEEIKNEVGLGVKNEKRFFKQVQKMGPGLGSGQDRSQKGSSNKPVKNK